MMSASPVATAPARLQEWGAGLSDDEVVNRVRAGDLASYEILMRRYNQRLYRAVRAILRSESEVEDVLQEAYLAAYQNLGDFEGRSRFSTWLVRIAVNKALDRRRRRARIVSLHPESEGEIGESDGGGLWARVPDDPEQRSARREFAHLLEEAIDTLPEPFRGVYLLRDVEGMTTQETAESLDLEPSTVKTRLHRARTFLRGRLTRDLDAAELRVFPFGAERCDRLVGAVLARLRKDGR